MAKKKFDPADNPLSSHQEGQVVTLTGMYQEYFLDYASYVILERAVPGIVDGLKPVQRRILHALREMDDGRFHKVANVIGQTMQYHPHGDAAIGDALVNLGQKDLLIDCQGNWGDIRTGDGAAAARYIEARLTKFALDVVFNPQTTEWQSSYDGRKREPVALPVKFPLLLAQGAEGIAVGLSTKIMPHNFIELIKASIRLLEGKNVTIYPDFQTGGSIDVADYNHGRRGGRIKVRAVIEKTDKNLLTIKELPYGVTTESMIDSIIKAADKGKIKVKKVTDNTAKDVEIAIELAPGVSPDVTMDALYAFSNCEVSISPNACIIVNNKPLFLSVLDILKINTENTQELLRQELEIKKHELEEKWHFASLEKIFIQHRIYHDIEECETWEAVLVAIEAGLKRYVSEPDEEVAASDTRLRLMRALTEDDLVRLTEIRIKRISKYNSFKADELIANIEQELEEVKHHLANIVTFTIDYYQNLLEKYGKGKERRTKIVEFEEIAAVEVVANNAKLYVNREEGFMGTGLKKDEFIGDCSDIDDIIVFRKDGKFQVSRISDKVFVGKNILHIAVWKKNDERTTYNMVYLDGKTGRSMVKRFNVTAITRDKEYDLTKGEEHSKTLYFTANPNGEAEILGITLSPTSKAKIKQFDFDFSTIDIKGRSSQGNILTKYPVRKIVQKEAGTSTLGAIKVWMDDVSGRLNTDERGRFLGDFNAGAQIIALYHDGQYEVFDFDITLRFDPSKLAQISKLSKNLVVTAVYYDGHKGWTMVKRFHIETSTTLQKFSYLTDHKSSSLLFVSTASKPFIAYKEKKKTGTTEEELDLSTFIDVKGWKAIGNRLSDIKISNVVAISKPLPETKEDESDDGDVEEETSSQELLFDLPEADTTPPAAKEKPKESPPKPKPEKKDGKLGAGDTIEFDF